MSITKVLLKPANCALDLGDGSERGLYVNQDYILHKLNKVHRGISLMYTWYPNDATWPTRACNIKSEKEMASAWDSPYENYFPYRGGREGLLDDEPFKFMKEIRQRGQEVVLTLTIDPELTREDIILLAKDLRPYGRLLLRVNHECTGSWFCYTRRSTYEKIADFFVMVCDVMHEYAPNVKMIICAGMYLKDEGKLEMEDIFLKAHKAADIWSGDNYLSLHWGWPGDVATKENLKTSHDAYDVDAVYEKCKATLHRLRKITGQDKPMVLSELNADGDVNGPFEQAAYMRHFMELLQKDDEKWLSAFTFYQFRDDGRLGLEITDPNNSEVGIEQPILKMYREQLHKPFFSQQIVTDGKIELPATLRWGSSEDAEGVELPCHFNKTPHFFELYFDGELENLNLMMEFGGYWFYKAPGVKCIDLMSYFFENPVETIESGNVPGTGVDIPLRIFCPPATGMNMPADKARDAKDGDWLYNSYTTLPALPRVRIEEEPVFIFKKY